MKAVNLEKLLPADIPPGERVLWFGRPEPVSLWRRAYRADWIALWFLAMTAWNFVSATRSEGAFAGAVSALRTLGFGAAALAILAGLAALSARTTLYVVSEKRLIVKSGIALPIFITVPFKQIVSANLLSHSDGTGDVAIAVNKQDRVPYLTLWPSARPLRFTRPEPTLRCVAGAREIAATIGRALSEASGQAPAPMRSPIPAGETGLIAAATV